MIVPALVQPSVDPAVALVRALAWSPAILLLGAAAALAAFAALTRRHPGEAALFFALFGGAVGLVLAEGGRGALAFGVAGTCLPLAAGAALVAGVARRIPEASRLAPGNEQRLLALAVVGLVAAAVGIAVFAVDWPTWDPAAASLAVVGGGLGAIGLVGVLTRRHWVSLALAGATCAVALVVLAAALPGPAAAPFAAAFLAWGAALGLVALALAATALERGHGPWVEPLEVPEAERGPS
ncbi:MAG: hypothetical protein ABIP29_08455 [Candidatus Eisenbacteria bacterium]